eukprot:c45568_g1_i1.p1 GENE.c45568_g1_i1~~c45568_g1_i1.p1  ORF type:complete len:715 (+),score=107.09 c45568_g1_i1:47-2191(+)
MEESSGFVDQQYNPYEPAVSVKGLYARYVSSVDVLHNISMTVPPGKVYVLLGASGAGKSTLLKTLIGQVEGEARVMWILGEPQLKNNQHIGYMPQVTGLINDLTVKETWESFAVFYGMDKASIESRTNFLVNYMGLTEQADQLCHTLSGGQKQRTSLGIALISSPKVLILDEPMTGLDPVLRQKLWDHLRHLSQRYGTTVIMSSQFFELACEADVVGLLHEGLLLVESSPRNLIANWTSAEGSVIDASIPVTSDQMGNAYDNVCRKYEELCVEAGGAQALTDVDYRQYFDKEHRPELDTCPPELPDAPPGEWLPKPKLNHEPSSFFGIRKRVCKSILKTHTRAYFRHLIPLILILISPVIELLIYDMIMGHPVKRMDVGVCNHDVGFPELPVNLSDVTLAKFQNLNDYHLVYLNCPIGTDSVATEAVIGGEMLAAIYFRKDYSKRIITASVTQDNMRFTLFLDTSAPIIATQISEDLYKAFQLTETSVNVTTRDVLSFVKPVYGKMEWRFSYYLAAGLVGMTTLVNGFVIALAEMTKREEDETHTRYRVAAISDMEFVVGNVIGFGSIHLPQSMFLLANFALLFNYHMSFSTFWILALVVAFLVAVSLVLSVTGGLLVQTQFDAILLMMTWFMPFMLLCGLFWPLESQPYVFRWISMLMPTTWGVSTFRAFLLKSEMAGWPNLMIHVLLCGLWILVFFNVALRLNNRKTKKIET